MMLKMKHLATALAAGALVALLASPDSADAFGRGGGGGRGFGGGGMGHVGGMGHIGGMGRVGGMGMHVWASTAWGCGRVRVPWPSVTAKPFRDRTSVRPEAQPQDSTGALSSIGA